MRLPKPSLKGAWWIPALGLTLLLALGSGWWLGRRTAGPGSANPQRQELLREADRLRARLDRGQASDAERQRLLELLVGLERKPEAISLLEPMADREPDRWSLRLMLAELRRDGGDRRGAERELRQVLSRHPLQEETLQLLSLLLLETGRGSEAETRVKSAYETAIRNTIRPQALGLGLLLAELQQRRGQRSAAQATLTRLAEQFPNDQRPLLALALLRREGGDTRGALEALAAARQRSGESAARQGRILDQLAAEWGLKPLRASPESKPGTPAPQTP
ncbi:MAG: tetratricopeptide repeat protein [Cyanobacteriota bacterium]|nr:tetratricopeptide repeat protein [Cyanobacteriota bacterium]